MDWTRTYVEKCIKEIGLLQQIFWEVFHNIPNYILIVFFLKKNKSYFWRTVSILRAYRTIVQSIEMNEKVFFSKKNMSNTQKHKNAKKGDYSTIYFFILFFFKYMNSIPQEIMSSKYFFYFLRYGNNEPPIVTRNIAT